MFFTSMDKIEQAPTEHI